MKYCPGLEDHVVVMTTEDQKSKNKICLSSHLCRTDERLSCGHERLSEGKRGEGTFF
jgi:hypothetical protein